MLGDLFVLTLVFFSVVAYSMFKPFSRKSASFIRLLYAFIV